MLCVYTCFRKISHLSYKITNIIKNIFPIIKIMKYVFNVFHLIIYESTLCRGTNVSIWNIIAYCVKAYYYIQQ